jgi:lectin, mannose-binding 2
VTQVEFEFKIHGNGHLFGDGFAMWITKQRATTGPVYGSTDKFEGLGIFFDTYKNNRPGVVFPYVMAMLGDGQTEYDQSHDGKANELAGCSARGIRDVDFMPTKAKLTYFQDSYLKLQLQYKDPDQWIDCFEVEKVTLPQVAYLGFSAETGELSDNHDIISVNAKNLYQPQGAGSGRSKSSMSGKHSTYKAAEKSGGGWGWFFLKLILFGVLCVGGYVGFTVYRARNRKSRF